MIRIKNNITPRLPNEYQELEYIQSTGTQCIDTGIPLNQYRKCEMEFSPTSIGTMQIIDGGYTNTSEQDDTRNYLRIDSDGMLNLQYAGSNTSYKLSSVVIASNTKYAISYKMLASSCSLTVNGTEYSNLIGVTLITNGNNVFLFGESFKDKNLTKTYEASALIKLYTAKYYDSNGILIRNFIPCYRKLDNEIGLYDLVNNVFYTNAGTGVFLMGEAVGTADTNLMPMIGNKKVLKRYIGENLVYGKETPNYEQKVNYTMLYDNGDECTQITGGWLGTQYYTNATVKKYTNYIHIHSYRATAYTANTVNLNEYVKILARMYTLGRSTDDPAQGINTADSLNLKNGMISGDSWSGILKMVKANPTEANYYNLYSNIGENFRMSKYIGIMVDDNKNKAYINLYNLAIFKQDNWQSLCDMVGIDHNNYTDEEALCNDSTSISTILNNRNAIEYMIYNCTGSFMSEFIVNNDCLNLLNNSQYKTIIQANEHWSKFLNMVA